MNLTYYSIDPRSNSARVSVLFILLSALIRVIYFSAKTPTLPVFLIHVLLVLAAAVLFVTFLVTLRRSKPAIMLLPVAMGVAFFIIKAFLDIMRKRHGAELFKYLTMLRALCLSYDLRHTERNKI